MLIRSFIPLIFAAALSGCAANGPPAEAYAFGKYERAELVAHVTLPGVVDGQETEAEAVEIERRFKSSQANCVTTFFSQLEQSLARKKPPTLAAADAEQSFASCLGSNGLSGYLTARVDGTELSMQRYVDEFAQAASNLHEAQAQRASREAGNANAWTMFGLALAGALQTGSQYQASQPLIFINPYIRQDGTPVMPHYRAAPNSACFDNLNGCR